MAKVQHTLKRKLGLFHVTTYGVGIILGAGVYTLISAAADETGNSLWLSFLIGAIIASLTGFSYAELASMMPKAAAEFTYIYKAFHNRLLAFLVGWLHVITATAAIATIALGFAEYLSALIPVPAFLAAAFLIVVLAYVNYLGIQESATANTIFTIVEVAGLIIIVILSLTKITHFASINYLQLKHGISGLLSASALVFFAYLGFEDIANVAEETCDARRVLPKAFLLAVAITTLLYVSIGLAVVNLASPEKLGQSEAPLAYAASQSFLGDSAGLSISIIALIATGSTILPAMIASTRMVYGMARHAALPAVLSKLDRSRRTPYVAIIVLAIAALGFLVIGRIDILAQVASFAALITFGLINSSLIILRYNYPGIDRHFRSPINVGRLPVLAVLGVLISIVMLFQFERMVMFYGALIVSCGIAAYFALNLARLPNKRTSS